VSRTLVLVSGPPAAGKTTVALPLAAALAWPLISKDDIKEALVDVLATVGVLPRETTAARPTRAPGAMDSRRSVAGRCSQHTS
jgi:predicted kinase